MRLQTIVIAFLVFALFGTLLINVSTDFMADYNITEDELYNNTDMSRAAFFNSVREINNMSNDLNALSSYAPGGGGASVANTEETSEDNILIAGFSFISNIGNFLFKYPVMMLGAVINFFGLPAEFTNIAIAAMILTIIIILVSSVLRNRL